MRDEAAGKAARRSVLVVHDRATSAACGEYPRRKTGKKKLRSCAKQPKLKKISGTVLLSHSRFYSTIAAGVLNYRVREGNVCCYPAMSTGKKHNKEKSREDSEECEAQALVES